MYAYCWGSPTPVHIPFKDRSAIVGMHQDYDGIIRVLGSGFSV